MRVVCAAFLLSLSAQVATQEVLRPLLDFDGPDTSQKWQAVNDGVMGELRAKRVASPFCSAG